MRIASFKFYCSDTPWRPGPGKSGAFAREKALKRRILPLAFPGPHQAQKGVCAQVDAAGKEGCGTPGCGERASKRGAGRGAWPCRRGRRARTATRCSVARQNAGSADRFCKGRRRARPRLVATVVIGAPSGCIAYVDQPQKTHILATDASKFRSN